MPPEAVCGLILQVPGVGLLPAQQRVLRRAAGSRQARYLSMSDDFDRPVPAVHKVQVLLRLLGKDVPAGLQARMAGDPWRLVGELQVLAPFVGWDPAKDYAGRLTRRDLAELGNPLVDGGFPQSKRQYNRLVRHLLRTQVRAYRMQQQVLLRQLVTVGRSGLAYSITVDEMRGDPAGACFVAYWVAQRNRRRAFTVAGRDNPFDAVAAGLLARCRTAGSDWWMIARAYPDPEVVARLSAARQGELMGQWFGFMRLAGELMHGLYDAWPVREVEPNLPDRVWAARPGLMPTREARGARTAKVVDLTTMVVTKGVDSSTWNTVAQAYNAARAGWINCLAAAGALELLDATCPGKAMRLMAGDLVAGLHGGAVDAETRVWAALPPPWEVLDDTSRIGRDTVEWACRQVGVDPEVKGWTAPRRTGQVADWKPTPDLVHGIAVGDPLWAGLLRRSGVFSGKPGTADTWPLEGVHSGGVKP